MLILFQKFNEIQWGEVEESETIEAESLNGWHNFNWFHFKSFRIFNQLIQIDSSSDWFASHSFKSEIHYDSPDL